MIGYHTPERLLLTLPVITSPFGITLRFLSHYPVVCFPNKILPVPIDALANSICHARVTVSGSHDFNELPSGFPIKIASGMTMCETISRWHSKGYRLPAFNLLRYTFAAHCHYPDRTGQPSSDNSAQNC